ncbi:MAG: hypothetical protein EA401_04300 [Planctomycetota bacterium]|nr:MAG: hypothetical protein EA401_04300 [Planctomycetota bacterium]
MRLGSLIFALGTWLLYATAVAVVGMVVWAFMEAGNALPLTSMLGLASTAVAIILTLLAGRHPDYRRVLLLSFLAALAVGGLFALFAMTYAWLEYLHWITIALAVVLLILLVRGRPVIALAVLIAGLAFFTAQQGWVDVRSLQADYDAWEARERERLAAVQQADEVRQRRQRELGVDSSVGGGAIYAEQTEEDILDVAGMGAAEGQAVDEVLREGRRAAAAADDPFAYRRQGREENGDDAQDRPSMERIRTIDVDALRAARQYSQMAHIIAEMLLVFVVLVALASYAHGMTRLRPTVTVLPWGRRWLDTMQPSPEVVGIVSGDDGMEAAILDDIITASMRRREPIIRFGGAQEDQPLAQHSRLPGALRPLAVRKEFDPDCIPDSRYCLHAAWYLRACTHISNPDLSVRMLADITELLADLSATGSKCSRRLTVIWDFPDNPIDPLQFRRLAHLLRVTHGRLVVVWNDQPGADIRGVCDRIISAD